MSDREETPGMPVRGMDEGECCSVEERRPYPATLDTAPGRAAGREN